MHRHAGGSLQFTDQSVVSENCHSVTLKSALKRGWGKPNIYFI